MSKPARKNKHGRRGVELPGEAKAGGALRMKSILLIAFVAVLAAIPFSLGKYFEFNSPGAFDSGAYVYSAAHILDGAEIGVKEIPSAQLGTLLVNLLGVRLFGFNDFGPKLIQMFLQVGALILMFIAMRRLFGSILPAAVGVILAAVFLSAPLIAKYGNVKEQYMIAFMLAGASCFVLYELSGKWWLAILAGGLVSWGPLFKQTGLSVIGGIGLFVVAQAVLKHKSVRQVGRDIFLLLAGVVLAMAPLFIWILVWDVKLGLPYTFVWRLILGLIPAGGAAAGGVGGYVGGSRRLVSWSEQWPRVLRYYWLLILPIALAVGAIIERVVRLAQSKLSIKKPEAKVYERFVLLFAAWWVLDMVFVWISPRSYEQYYLPLNASAGMLSGYLAAIYYDKARAATNKGAWIGIGVFAVVAMAAMSWHIFFGITTSPHTGQPYPRKARGYQQKYREVAGRRKGAWERIGEYIRANSAPTDKMYVWGWYPGMYVSAQRFSSAASAFTMPRPFPALLDQRISRVLEEFNEEMPKFIVDSRKLHIPTDRPPYALWPVVPKGFMGQPNNWFLPRNERVIAEYDKQWKEMLGTRFDEAEAQRYEILGAFRKFVRDNYEIVQPQEYVSTRDPRFLIYHKQFGTHVLFKLKEP